MRKKDHRKWYRHPKTTNERKQNQETEFVRGRRHPQNLPTAYDDIPVQHPKTKKDYSKRKYKDGGRGKQYTLTIPNEDYTKIYKIKEYFRKQNIPHRVEKICTKKKITQYIYHKYVPWGLSPRMNSKGKQIGWKTNFKEIKLDKPIEKCYTVHTTVAYKIVWWSDKDIGLEYLC